MSDILKSTDLDTHWVQLNKTIIAMQLNNTIVS